MSKRTFLYIFATVVLLAAGGAVVLWTNLDWIVKHAIERYGSQATKTAVRVRSVSLLPGQGRGSIEGLTVANPRGFSTPHALSLGRISVRLSPSAVAANPVVVDEIRVTAPLVVYEMNESRTSNVDALRKNLNAGAATAERKPERTKGANSKGTRLRIKRLVIENAKVEVRAVQLGGRPRSLALRRLEMFDLGGKNGAPPDQLGGEVLSAVLSEVSAEVGKAGASLLMEKGLERLFRRR